VTPFKSYWASESNTAMKQLPTQLPDPDAIKAVLKHAPFTLELGSGEQVQAMAMYLPAKEGKTSHEQFFELARGGLLQNFVLSCSEIQKKLGTEMECDPEDLLRKALRKLSKRPSFKKTSRLRQKKPPSQSNPQRPSTKMNSTFWIAIWTFQIWIRRPSKNCFLY